MQANENPYRVYACGDEISDEQVNFDENIGSVSASGVYPLGASPYGCHDLNGSVWEWTRTQRNEYPYPAVGTQAWNDLEAQELSDCVLRGGAFDFDQSLVRCAIRDYNWPDRRGNDIGFRVILSPLL
jgi:formylglycine-generating enzyme required for sulfatase activity